MTKMKKLLFLFDTDPYASVFDTVVAYDGGADRVTGYANVTPDNVGALVDGNDFHPRRQGEAEHRDLRRRRRHGEGRGAAESGEEEVLRPVPRLGDARSERLQHHGGGRRGAACQGDEAQGQEGGGARRHRSRRHAGRGAARRRKAPTSPSPRAQKKRAENAAQGDRGPLRREGQAGRRAPTRQRAPSDLEDAQIVFAAGAIGVELVPDSRTGKDNPTIEAVADVNAQPPLGLEGIEATDKGKERYGKLCFGALGIGGLKLKLHRACIGKLFETSEAVFDAEEIYALAKEMA